MQPSKTAFVSVADKAGLAAAAKDIGELGFRLFTHQYSGTDEALRKASLIVESAFNLMPFARIAGRSFSGLLAGERHLHTGVLAWLAEKPITELVHMGFTPINLVWMEPEKLPTPEELGDGKALPELDSGYITMMAAAIRGGRLTIPNRNWIDNVVRWLQQGQPNREQMIQEMGSATKREVAQYLRDHDALSTHLLSHSPS